MPKPQRGKPTMKIPASVKVGPFTYRIERVDDLRSASDAKQKLCGQVHFGEDRIEIRTAMAPEREAETLLHEAIHAIDEYMGTNLTEKQTARLSIGLMAFLRDNHLLREE